GLRTIERKDRAGTTTGMILLNGRPVYLRGVLDQSFNPQGICTAPSDGFMRRDMQIARDLGCNFIRIHIKSEEPRRLYWADRMGLLLMADMPCTFKHTARARAAWEKTMRATIGRDRNHPSIIAWCLFNESWGLGRHGYKSDKPTQDWVLRMWTLVKDKLDPSRLVEDNSPCLGDHVKTDINSWHFYIDDHARAGRAIETMVRGSYPGSSTNYVAGKKQRGEPLIVSEYGAVGSRDGDRDISWGFRFLTTQLRRHGAIQGYAYTELTDIEWEHNGLVNYDRSAKEFGYGAFVPGMRVADLQGADFIGFDAPPVFEVAPQETFTVPVFVSHFSRRRGDPRLRWRIVGTDNLGQAVETPPRERAVVWRPYDVTFQKPLRVTVPTGRPFVGALTLELLDEKGERLGANYINLIVRPISTKVLPSGEVTSVTCSPRVEVLGPNRVVLRFDVDDFSSFNSRRPLKHWLDRRGKFVGLGNCSVAYRVSLPVFVREAVPAKLILMTELATKSDDERLDWPAVRRRLDCPQTEERKHPGRVAASLLDERLWQLDLPDDPADSRGVLSHQNRFEHGSFGYLVRKKMDLTRRHALREKLCNDPSFTVEFQAVPNPPAEGGDEKKDAEKKGTGEKAAGISLFGERTGRYPIDPTIIIETARKLSHAPGWTSTGRVSVDRLLDRAELVDVIKTAESGGHEWRFTTDEPGPDWAAPQGAKTAPDGSKWKVAASGFGRPANARIRVATPWETPQIWLRTQAALPADPMQIVLRYYHSGNTEFFVNGKSLAKLAGGTPGYRELTLDKQQMKLFRKGTNTIAVHCRNGKGRQALDVGLRCIVVER
ncbi:MAG: glycoside hydrolase family 2 TIM barrel-domain containing protein, partial [Planctomycetota bacterium]|nr:glycoside hydrolase family 2 TIM barrel-domain containing protein [Planctomycetota bacterium]